MRTINYDIIMGCNANYQSRAEELKPKAKKKMKIHKLHAFQ